MGELVSLKDYKERKYSTKQFAITVIIIGLLLVLVFGALVVYKYHSSQKLSPRPALRLSRAN